MTNYKGIKITFDIDDPNHLTLYNYLKKQTNGSSFIRSLLYENIKSDKGDTRTPPILKEPEKISKTVAKIVTEDKVVQVKKIESEIDFSSLI